MHYAAYQWVVDFAEHYGPFTGTVVEFGSQDINGTVRGLFADAKQYIGIDPQDGPGVDVVGDAVAWATANRYGRDGGLWIEADCVICTEVFEHTADWRELIRAAAQLLGAGGRFVCTAAGPGRPVHSMYPDGLRDGEWYENIHPDQLRHELLRWFGDVVVDVAGDDVRGYGTKF